VKAVPRISVGSVGQMTHVVGDERMMLACCGARSLHGSDEFGEFREFNFPSLIFS